MKRSSTGRSTVPKRRPTLSSLPRSKPLRPAMPSRPVRKPPPRPARPPVARRDVARIIDDGDRSLLDVVDNLLNSGVMLNADLMLALADVDLVYVRLSALLCAADRVFPPDGEV
jgi:hypothetical protein